MVRSILQLVPGPAGSQEALAQVAQALSVGFRHRGIPCETVYHRSFGTALADELDLANDAVLLVHYVGYGYAKRGAPLALARRLAEWRCSGIHRKLLVQFHEIAGFGPPWRSSFWMRPFQLLSAKILARSADGAVTSLGRYQEQLREIAKGLRVVVLPVLSTVGEPQQVPAYFEREQGMVLFGSPGARHRMWREVRKDLETAAAHLSVARIIEVGRGTVGPENVGGIQVERVGELSQAAVSSLLTSVRVGFLAYHPAYLPKSTVYAAFAAHGVLPVCAWRRSVSLAGTDVGMRWCMPCDLLDLSDKDAGEIASGARLWYLGHAASEQVQVLLGLIG